MVINDLKIVLEKNKSIQNKVYLRNLLKEVLQVYVLNFIYTNPEYKDLIFTGGTCLRKFYSLNRVSEDLDFDIEGKDFNYEKFQKDLEKYFVSNMQYKQMSTKYKNKTIFLKFPVLREIGFSGPNDSEILMLRLDFSKSFSKSCKTTTHLFSSYNYNFIVKSYDFPTLMANKVTAFLTRTFRKGDSQKESFKGRDAFDLVWMLDGTRNKDGINMNRISDMLKIKDKEDLKKEILKKAKKISSKDLYFDIRNFFAEEKFVKEFSDNFYKILNSSIKYL
ncbi:nucleotidyl transferase AbiEii/AbiGii toxin family protein [Candidatus Microgenomates bacterium]|nr:nucleotidyl transferase AbiEii/AbiGii toxin family protein [Candidatus Microgenomates bacterium]